MTFEQWKAEFWRLFYASTKGSLREPPDWELEELFKRQVSPAQALETFATPSAPLKASAKKSPLITEIDEEWLGFLQKLFIVAGWLVWIGHFCYWGLQFYFFVMPGTGASDDLWQRATRPTSLRRDLVFALDTALFVGVGAFFLLTAYLIPILVSIYKNLKALAEKASTQEDRSQA